MQKQNEKQGQDKEPDSGEKINEFIQKNRKPILVTAVTAFLVLIAVIVALSITEVLRVKAVAAVEDFNSRYETLRPTVNEEYSQDDVASFIEELTAFAKKHSGYPGGRAWLLIGGVYTEKKDWAEAETAFIAAAKASAKTYLAPLAWFNAAVVAEEQGKTNEAIEYYGSSLKSQAVFSAAPRAQFSIGRLNETLNEGEKAIDAYRAVIAGWPNDQVWTNLARSRIITLETKTDVEEVVEE